jgi:hypothetical protein
MTQETALKTALDFFRAYSDPEIAKRLYFDVWADRVGLDSEEKSGVWREVRRLTHRFAAEKGEVTRRRNAGARSQFAGGGELRGAVGDERDRGIEKSH